MKKNKIVSLALAGTLTATALLAGTYAWTAISQEARNEVEGSVNPGARLHDDFNGENKDIYVENFTTDGDGAVIYARIKLTEYLEIGGKAVENSGVTPEYDKEETWITFSLDNADNNIYRNYFEWTWGKDEIKTYMPTFNKNKDSLDADVNGTIGGIDADKTTDTAYEDYIEYATGGSAYETVKNSHTVGSVTDDVVPAGTTVGTRYGLEIYDIDDDEDQANDARDEAKDLSAAIIKALHNGTGGIKGVTKVGDTVTLTKADGTPTTATVMAVQDEETDGVLESVDIDLDNDNDADIRVKALEMDTTVTPSVAIPHTVKQTQVTTDVITMAEWKALPDAQKQGNYWVYDSDGWAYWANGIKPGEATGTLLTAIERTGSIVDRYYYAIDVTAEFATAGDWGKEAEGEASATGFHINEITPDGLQLLNTIAGEEKDVMISAASTEVKPGHELQLTSTVKLGAQTLTDDVTWTLNDADKTNAALSQNTSIDPMTGLLSVGADETSQNIWVTAYLTRNPNVKAHKLITVTEKLIITVTTANNAANLVIPENITSLAMSASVQNQWNENRDANVTWELKGGTYTDTQIETAAIDEDGTVDQDYTKIDPSTGVLTVGTEEKSAEIVVVAKSTVDEDAETEFTVNLKTQLQYLDEISKDSDKWGLVDTHIKIDGINWYILNRADVDEDNAEEVLLWASRGVTGWGGPASENYTCNWPYWSTTFAFNQDTADDADSDKTTDTEKANWWRYSNARAWLNDSTQSDVIVSENKYGDDTPTETTGNKGFLVDKEILRDHAAIVSVMTKKEFNSNETVLEDNYIETDDKIFLLTQADIYGHTSDASGNSSTNLSSYDYTVPGMTTGSLLKETDYVLNETTYSNSELMRKSRNLDNDTTLSEWSWLRSPRANVSLVASIIHSGAVDHFYYTNTSGGLRPALWMNLTSSTQGGAGQ